MSARNFCDYPECQREATTRITEEPYGFLPDGLSARWQSALDACDEHRAVTHPGWWCMDHEEVLRQQALRKASVPSALEGLRQHLATAHYTFVGTEGFTFESLEMEHSAFHAAGQIHEHAYPRPEAPSP